MPTFTALTTLDDRDRAEALGAMLEDLEPAPTGVGVFEMEDGSGLWEVGGYFLEAPDDVALALLAAAQGAKDFVVSEVPETDWVAHVRRELHPVEAGRFFVYGAHDADAVPEGRVALLIEAAMAFGTGHHGTTQGCLEALERLIAAGADKHNVVDIGCGTGLLLKIVSHSYPAIKLHGCDITPAMITKARLALGSAVDLKVAAAEQLPYVQQQFDFAICNSAAQHFLSIPNALHEAERVLKPGVQFVLTAWSTDELIPRLHYKLLQARNVAIQQVMNSAEYCKQLELAGFYISAVQPFRAGPQWGLVSISASKSR